MCVWSCADARTLLIVQREEEGSESPEFLGIFNFSLKVVEGTSAAADYC